MGDWNAKIQEADNEEEEQWIGNHTFDKGEETTWQQTLGVEENREGLLEICRTFGLIICNTQFQKPPKHLATWRTMGAKEGDPIDRQHFDQIDFILTPARWRNGVKDAGSDLEANIDSDHAPVWAKCHFKLKKQENKAPTSRTRVEPMEESRKEDFNKELNKEIRNLNGEVGYIKMCEIIKEIVPKHFEITTISRKRNSWALETENAFKDRDRARQEGKWDEAQEHNKKFRKLLRNDKAKQLMKEFEEDLDLRSKWMGLRMLRKGYSQAPYHRNNKEGRHIKMQDRAEEAAKYLSDTMEA